MFHGEVIVTSTSSYFAMWVISQLKVRYQPVVQRDFLRLHPPRDSLFTRLYPSEKQNEYIIARTFHVCEPIVFRVCSYPRCNLQISSHS